MSGPAPGRDEAMNVLQTVVAGVVGLALAGPAWAVGNEERKELLRMIAPATLIEAVPHEQVKHPRGRLPYEVVVFTRPGCPGCRKVHSQRDRYAQQGIRIRYAPIGNNNESRRWMSRIWCAENRREAMTRAKRNKRLPRCNDGGRSYRLVARLNDIGYEMGVRSTPTWILPNGAMVRGVRTPRKMVEFMRRMRE